MLLLANRQSPIAGLKSQIGCWIHERWRTELAIRNVPGFHWEDLCNRNEAVVKDNVSGGRICEWRDSSHLTINRVSPAVGTRLLRHVLRHWPLQLNFETPRLRPEKPEASVLIAIGGSDRLNQFRTVLAALRGQSHGSMELLVVEQSRVPELDSELPADVRYFHDAHEVGLEFNKSRALNFAAREARGKYLLIHDADYVVPRDYVAECCRVLNRVDGVRPSRLNFHLNQSSTEFFTSQHRMSEAPVSEFIVQNNPTPMALRAKSYWDIGGHDESFIGWGGEDVEFLSRLRTLTMSEGGWMPTIHLWHPPAPRKASGHRNQQQQDEMLATDPRVRIERLRSCVRHG